MFLKVRLTWNVIISPENLDLDGSKLRRAVIIQLMEDFATKNATKDLGYLTAVTTLENIGEGRVRMMTGEILFPVSFCAVTFKVLTGEILEGIVDKVTHTGIFLRCGPIKHVYVTASKMPGWCFENGKSPVFVNDDLARMETNVSVRFLVIGTQWLEHDRGFQVLGSLDGDFLGLCEH